MRKTSIIILAIITLIFATTIGLWYIWYKGGIEPSSAYVDVATGKQSDYGAQLLFHGIKLPWISQVLFKRYYAIFEKDHYTGLTTVINYEGEGYNCFYAFYRNGTMASHGLCMVSKNDDQILHDVHDIKEAEFYDPKGATVSTIKNGSGVQTLFFSNGQKYWELRLENKARKKLTIWNQNGTVRLEKEY